MRKICKVIAQACKELTLPPDSLEHQQETLATVRAVDGATAPGAPCGAGCTLYPSTRNAPVEAIFHPGGHVYPPWAPARIVEFFKAHALVP